MDLSHTDRVALRLADDVWRWRKMHVATVRRLKRAGLLEDRHDADGYASRLTAKGLAVRAMLKPEPRPDWHDPEWQRANWKLDHLPDVPAPTDAERAAFGWYDGQPTPPYRPDEDPWGADVPASPRDSIGR